MEVQERSSRPPNPAVMVMYEVLTTVYVLYMQGLSNNACDDQIEVRVSLATHGIRSVFIVLSTCGDSFDGYGRRRCFVTRSILEA